MTAEIVPFPKPLKKKQAVDLVYCWEKKLDNPYLNSIYMPTTSYVERWYLEIVHNLNKDDLTSPISKILLSKEDITLDILYVCTKKDLEHHLEVQDLSYICYDSAQYNITRLNRWLRKWEILLRRRGGI